MEEMSESEGSEQFVNAFWLICVAALWGGTNPWIKKGSKGIENIKKESPVKQFLAELLFLFSNWKGIELSKEARKASGIRKSLRKNYLVPFLINQSGSVVFYITLSTADLSLAVPITNSLTFIFTSISSKFMGEQIGNWETYAGMIFVVIGVTICVISKL